MQTNLAVVALPNVQKTIRAIDVPGHPRIRDQFNDYLPEAKAIAFVVDSGTISRNGAAVAEYVSFMTPIFLTPLTLVQDISIISYTP